MFQDNKFVNKMNPQETIQRPMEYKIDQLNSK